MDRGTSPFSGDFAAEEGFAGIGVDVAFDATGGSFGFGWNSMPGDMDEILDVMAGRAVVRIVAWPVML